MHPHHTWDKWRAAHEERRARRKAKRRKRDGCDLDDLECCDGGCDLFFFMFIIACMNYFRVAPVTEGRRSARPVMRLVRSYQRHVSAHRPAVCNLSPTCSNYGLDVLRRRGVLGLIEVRARLRACGDAGRTDTSSVPTTEAITDTDTTG